MFSPVVWRWIGEVLGNFVFSVVAGLVANELTRRISQHKGPWFRWPPFWIGFGVFLVPVFFLVNIPRYPPVAPPLAEGNATLSEAMELASARGVSLSVTRQFMPTPEKERVALQNPPAGTRIAKGGKIAVTVSAGPYPQVVGRQEALAIDALHRAGLDPEIERFPSLTYERGVVAQQEPENGEDVRPGEKVRFVVSTGGPPPVISIGAVHPLPDYPVHSELEVRVGGFAAGLVVVGWLEDSQQVFYRQGAATVLPPNNKAVTMPNSYRLRLWQVSPEKRLWVTVHSRGNVPPPALQLCTEDGNLADMLQQYDCLVYDTAVAGPDSVRIQQ